MWFKNRGESNYFFLTAADRFELPDTLGGTVEALNYSFIFVPTISDNEPGSSLAVAEVIVHELGHQFGLLHCDTDHPPYSLAHTGTDSCVMSYNGSLVDGIAEFCLDGPDHLQGVRDAIDPR